MNEVIEMIREMRAQAARATPIPDVVSHDGVYRLGYGNGFSDALDEVLEILEDHAE